MPAERPPAITLDLEVVRAALALPHFDAPAGRSPMTPETRRLHPPVAAEARQAAVLILLWPQEEGLHFVLTRRATQLRGHGGQISFPGGRRDPTDVDAMATALRETQEELGVPAPAVQVLGRLDEIFIPPSNYLVQPVVGALGARPAFRPRAAEVAGVLVVPVAQLFEPARKRQSLRQVRGRKLRIPWYALARQMVWGATAMLLSEFEQRLRTVMAAPAAHTCATPTSF